MRYLVTGGSGFIGINLIKKLLKNKNNKILNIDNLTYASNNKVLNNLPKSNYKFIKKNINQTKEIFSNLVKFKPNIIFNLAAESHVDNSLNIPALFLKTNIFGTYSMLESSMKYYNSLTLENKKKFKFIHISTDEVYGSNNSKNLLSTENSIYLPNSPYSASKASSDHLVRSWFKSYGLPTIITNCSNNYGPFQNKEKLIPMIIHNAIHNKSIGIYDNGKQIRDWIHVSDHVNALITIAQRGKIGEKYNIGSNNRISNINLTVKICNHLDNLIENKQSHKNLIKFVDDRPGHDWRYALNTKKINSSTGWYPKVEFSKGLFNTIKWYISYYKNL